MEAKLLVDFRCWELREWRRRATAGILMGVQLWSDGWQDGVWAQFFQAFRGYWSECEGSVVVGF